MLQQLLQYKIVNTMLHADTRRQGIRFLFVGAVNTVFSYGCYASFIYIGYNYALAAFFATCLGIIFNFNTTGRIVFKNMQ